MDFAKNLLLKYGWKEGKGLGKNESGITVPIKPKLKFNTQGIGFDSAETFTYNWWEVAFNRAASNIQVAKTEEGISMVLQDDDMEITTKKKSRKKEKDNPLEYGAFIKTSKLTKGGEMMRISQDVPEISNPDYRSLQDEDLFRICGGHTAHKGARHGLNLNGKLARIEEQDKLFLAKYYKKSANEDSSELKTDGNMRNKKKHKEILHESRATVQTISREENLPTSEKNIIKRKKSDRLETENKHDLKDLPVASKKKGKSKQRRECFQECESLVPDEMFCETESLEKKKNKKRKDNECTNYKPEGQDSCEDQPSPKRKHKKR